MPACKKCGNTEYTKRYICGLSYEDALDKDEIYCDTCIKDKAKKVKKILGIKIRGTSK